MLNLKESNDYIINLIQKNEPFFVARTGCGELFASHYYALNKCLNKTDSELTKKLGGDFFGLTNSAGIYGNSDDDFVEFAKKYDTSIINSTALAYQQSDWIKNEQEYYIKTYNLDTLYSRVLEPFYCCIENIKPWSQYLLGKKVLIVNPFTDSMKIQVYNGFQIFKDPKKKIFLPGQELKFYKSFNTAANNKIHSNWKETFDIMCEEISKIDFDVALLGCGGYGLLISNYIYTNLNKSVIYIGGGLQLLFGIMGKRWENIDLWKKIIAENDTKFIRPLREEHISNKKNLEELCDGYW